MGNNDVWAVTTRFCLMCSRLARWIAREQRSRLFRASCVFKSNVSCNARLSLNCFISSGCATCSTGKGAGTFKSWEDLLQAQKLAKIKAKIVNVRFIFYAVKTGFGLPFVFDFLQNRTWLRFAPFGPRLFACVLPLFHPNNGAQWLLFPFLRFAQFRYLLLKAPCFQGLSSKQQYTTQPTLSAWGISQKTLWFRLNSCPKK